MNGPMGVDTAGDNSRLKRNLLHGLLAGAALAGLVGALYFPLLFTNRVLATGDILLYFYPYRDYVAEILRSGAMPFWNPYIFAGAPLLANPQTAVLYPLHWPLIWLPVTKQVYWSAAIHTWLFGYGGYWLMRRWGVGAWGSLLTGLVLAGSGLMGGLVGHLNQLNAAAWLPWAALCLERSAPNGRALHLRAEWPSLLGRSIGFGVVVSLMLLAGHTQTVYIIMFGLGMWVLWSTLAALWRSVRSRRKHSARPPLLDAVVASRLIVYPAGVALALLLAAPQLLSTLELSGLGLRTGGLDFLEATSFSLKPLALAWTLVPNYGLASLEAVFDSPAYTEYVAYVGLLGLLLALVGAWRGRGRPRSFGILLALLGLLLALGHWDPAYYLLHQFVPGFALFRVPARWMLLYTLGVAVLAGLGFEQALLALRRSSRWPWPTPWGYRAVAGLVVGLVAAELMLAARALPYVHPTAPEAVTGVRTAPAHLLTDPDRQTLGPAATGRFLGLSTITYDPGDMADYKRIMLDEVPPQLTPQTFADLVIAQKVQELLVPNLALLWRIPSVDGFDGGVLPLQRFNTFVELFIPPDTLGRDGRLREQVKSVLPASVLNLMDVHYLITDKVSDLWFENVYYDRAIGARLDAARPATEIDAGQPFAATDLDLIGYVDVDPAQLANMGAPKPVAEVVVASADGYTQTFPLTAGSAPGAQLADPTLASPVAAASGAVVAYQDVDGQRQEYRVRLPLEPAVTPASITVRSLDSSLPVVIQAATLLDTRTQMFSSLLPSDRGHFARVHSGDVKIYQNLDAAQRAFLVPQTVEASDAANALELLRAEGDFAQRAVVEGMPPLQGAAAPGDQAQITAYGAERVEVRTSSAGPALLVLADAYYPGWTATVDGVATPIYPTNVLFRGVPVPAGEHQVVFTFQPTGWSLGLWLAGAGCLLVVAAMAVLAVQRLRRRRLSAV